MIVRLDKTSTTAQGQSTTESEAESDHSAAAKVSEAEKIVLDTKQKIAEGTAPAVGVSASNSGRGYDTIPTEGGEFVVTTLRDPVEEETESAVADDDSPEVSVTGTVHSETVDAAAKAEEEPKK